MGKAWGCTKKSDAVLETGEHQESKVCCLFFLSVVKELKQVFR
jgi:hypothetical protein